MKIAKIYRIWCLVNGKSYIGFTSQPTNKRWNQHLWRAKTSPSQLLERAISKYGKEQFRIEEIYASLDIDHTVSVMEEFFIRQHNTHFQDGHGYNMNYGGRGTHRSGNHNPMSEERKTHLRLLRLGTTLSDETKAKIAAAGRGRRHTPTTIAKMKRVTRSKEFKMARRAYRVPPDKIRERVENRKSLQYRLLSPAGPLTIETNDFRQWCEGQGLKPVTLYLTLKERRPITRGTHQGWQLIDISI